MKYTHCALMAATMMVAACGSDPLPAEETTPPEDDGNTEVLAPAGPVFVGGERPTEVYAPTGYDHATPTPLVVVLHGYTASGALMNAYLGLTAHADERGFLLLTPDGTRDAQGNAFWNASDACCDFLRTNVDDSAYIRALIDETSEVYNVDAARVFVVGHSNGGFMAYRMACDHADRVAAIVSLAGAMPSNTASCAMSEPVAALQIHGTADETVLYDGGAFAGFSYPSAVDTVASFAGVVGCSTAAAETGETRDLEASVDGAETSASRHESCASGGAAELWTMSGVGHIPSVSTEFMPATLDFLFAHPKE